MGYNLDAIPTLSVVSKFPSLEDCLRQIRDVWKEALAAQEMARIKMAERYPLTYKPFKEGEKVWLEAKNLNVGGEYCKLRSLREGPFIIDQVMGPLTYKLRLPRQWKIHPVFHATLLSPYKETATHGPSFSMPPPDLIDDEEEYKVETIVRHKRVKGGSLWYLIKWVGYPISKNSWQSEEHLENAKEILDAYKRRSALA